MSIYLALDKLTNDLIKSDSGGIVRVKDGRFVVQQVQAKLTAQLGEWIPDPTIGWLKSADFEKDYDSYDLERRARQIILATQGVSTITSLSSFLVGRQFNLQFTATTIYGEIELTIPWGVQ